MEEDYTKIDSNPVNWNGSFLTVRRLQLDIDGQCGIEKKENTGVP